MALKMGLINTYELIVGLMKTYPGTYRGTYELISLTISRLMRLMDLHKLGLISNIFLHFTLVFLVDPPSELSEKSGLEIWSRLIADC